MKKYGLVLFSIGMAACGAPAAQAQNTCMEGQKMNTFLQAYLPTNYGEMSRRSVQTDGEAVELVRYSPQGVRQPNGAESISALCSLSRAV